MFKKQRLYFLDWLRALSLIFLLIYHIAIIFQPFAREIKNIYFPLNTDLLQGIWFIIELVGIFHLPLLFFISGAGIYFSIGKRNWKEIFFERSQKIFLPLIFCTITVVQLQEFIYDKYFKINFSSELLFNTSHLWFLTNIYFYTIILLFLLPFLKKKFNNLFNVFLKKLVHVFSFFGIFFISLPFILESLVIPNNQHYLLFAFSVHGYINGFISFFLGFFLISLGKNFLNFVDKNKYNFLFIAISLYLIRFLIFNFGGYHILTAIESINWLFSIVGFGYKYLNKPSKILKYLNNAILPVYIIHMIFLYIGSVIILPIKLNPIFKLLFLIFFVFIFSFLFYELIKRIRFFNFLFGVKMNKKEKLFDN